MGLVFTGEEGEGVWNPDGIPIFIHACGPTETVNCPYRQLSMQVTTHIITGLNKHKRNLCENRWRTKRVRQRELKINLVIFVKVKVTLEQATKAPRRE